MRPVIPRFPAPFGWIVLLLIAVSLGCSSHPKPSARPRPILHSRKIASLGFTIQVGAFAQVENAARLAESLQKQGLEATYYASSKDLYRVRFGNFPTKDAARERAEALRSAGVIQTFFVVPPEEVGITRTAPADVDGLRAGLVQTAQSYLGVPYLWGGTSEQGFDCSGLAMSVYRLNGLQLPRSSQDQYEAGTPVALESMQAGDLLFFATGRSGRVSHVAIYIGGGAFIHAPGKGRGICQDRLSDRYFQNAFLGARAYL